MSLQRKAPGASQRRVQGILAGYIYLPSTKTTVIVYVDTIKLIFIFYLSSCLVGLFGVFLFWFCFGVFFSSD